MTNKTEEILVPLKIATHQDKKTGARSAAFPFVFPDGENGVVIVTRLKDGEWKPSNHIEKITLHLI